MRAHDAAGNQSGNSNTVTRTGQTGDTTAADRAGNLAYTQPAVRPDPADLDARRPTTSASPATTSTQRLAARQRQRHHADLHRQPAGHRHGRRTTCRASDAAGNKSAASNTVTRTGTGGGGTNLAVGKPITGTGSTCITFVAANANDDDVTTYWEGAGLPEHAHRAARRQRRPQLGRGQAQPGPGLGHPYPDHPGARPRAERVGLHHAGRRGELHASTRPPATR